MGVGMKTDGWPGAECWADREDDTITLDTLIERCEAIVVGADGGGRDDLFGLTVLGREPALIEIKVVIAGKETIIKTKRWLSWSFAWCHKSVLDRRKTIAALLQGFHDAGEIRIIDDKLQDIAEIVSIIERISDAGLLACVAIDPEGPYAELVDALDEIGINEASEQVVGVGQSYKLMSAIKSSERKLTNGTFYHARSGLMDWCVGNVKIEPTATAIRATKQNAGDAKIDPVMALFDAATVMVRNPEAKGSKTCYEIENRGFLVL
jgi:phage terminase large subunit-like protein